MESITTILNVLRELLKINKERVQGYRKASHNTDDPGLKAMFLNMAEQGRKNITDILKEIIEQNGNTGSTKTISADKIYVAWATFKSWFSDKSLKSVLTSCESMETTALHVYQKARTKAFSVQMTNFIERHELALKSSHEVIRVYRQAYLKLDELYS